MIKFINLFVIGFVLSCAAFGDDKISQKCKVDQDCVLFQDLCNKHSSITKESLPPENFSEIKNGVLVYSLKSSVESSDCLKHYFVPNVWSEHTEAKCINQRCEVIIGKPRE